MRNRAASNGPPGRFHAAGCQRPYLFGDVIGGRKARVAKMRAAKIKPLSPAAAGTYMASLDRELREQTAGIGLDVLNLGSSVVIRVPATFTFDAGSAAVKPQTDATLLEIARTVKTKNQTFVDVLAHTDTSGNAAGQPGAVGEARRRCRDLSYQAWRRPSRASHRRAMANPCRSTIPDTTETEKAANRRIEIRLVPYTG